MTMQNQTEQHIMATQEQPVTAGETMVTGVDRTKRLVRAGIFSLVGFAILVVGVFVIGDKQNLFTKTFDVQSHFRTVEGLRSGALVTINGIKVGTVSRVQLRMSPDSGSYVHVAMKIANDYRDFIRTTTVATVTSTGLIGEKIVELRTGDPTAPVARNGALLPSLEPTNYTAIFDQAKQVVMNTENITASLDTLFLRFRRGEGTLGKFLTDDEVYVGLARVAGATEKTMTDVASSLSSVTNTLNRAMTNVDGITVETRKLVNDISSGKGSLGALLYDRSVYDSLEQVLATLDRTADAAGFAAREFGVNMRGLRQHWLVGGLFGGADEDEANNAVLTRELQIKLEEVKRQRELLEQREQEALERNRPR